MMVGSSSKGIRTSQYWQTTFHLPRYPHVLTTLRPTPPSSMSFFAHLDHLLPTGLWMVQSFTVEVVDLGTLVRNWSTGAIIFGPFWHFFRHVIRRVQLEIPKCLATMVVDCTLSASFLPTWYRFRVPFSRNGGTPVESIGSIWGGSDQSVGIGGHFLLY